MAADAAARTETAPAKVNLYLHLCGLREDGYHLLDSLAVFPRVSDTVALDGPGPGLAILGPQSESLATEPGDDNLVLRAATALAAATGRTFDAGLTLHKTLPVASGIGGGSSDAAATLRLLARRWGCGIPADLALNLGADVPVCLCAPRPTRMQGIGEHLSPVPELPSMAMLLVNPLVAVPTGAVFKATTDKHPPAGPPMPGRFAGFEAFCAWLDLQRNDLQPAAEELCPQITTVLQALHTARLARMSGSGATCFGLYPDLPAAEHAADTLRSRFPKWWIAAAPV